MKVGIIGAGFMGATHALGWAQTEATIAGFLAKPGEAAAEEIARQYQTKIFSSLDAMLANVDIVDICTPTHLHYDMGLKAAAAKKHIFCEKPLTRTLDEGQKLIAACKENSVQLSVGHVVRFFPEYQKAKATVENGQIGKLATLRLSRESFRPKKAVDNWFIDFSKSGGMILDLMIHDMDFARWLAGEVKTVFAKNISSTNPDAQIDHALVILTHHNGAISHIEGSWAYPPPMFRTQFQISGSGGMIDHDSQAVTPIHLYMHQKTDGEAPDVPLPTSPLDEDPWTTEIKAFYNALVSGQSVPVAAEDGLAALQIGLAALESICTNEAVTLDPLPELSL